MINKLEEISLRNIRKILFSKDKNLTNI